MVDGLQKIIAIAGSSIPLTSPELEKITIIKKTASTTQSIDITFDDLWDTLIGSANRKFNEV